MLTVSEQIRMQPILQRRTLGVFVCSLLALIPLYLLMVNANPGRGGDAVFYRQAAGDPFSFVRAPFSFRILTPLLVWAMPVHQDLAFPILTLVFLAATMAALFSYLTLFYEEKIAFFGLGIFLMSNCVRLHMDNPFLVDPLSYLFTMLGFLFLAQRRWLPLVIALTIGVLAKETVLFVLVLAGAAFVADSRAPQSDWTRMQWGLVLCLPIFVYVVFHFTPFVWGKVPPSFGYSSTENLSAVVSHNETYGSIPKAFSTALLYSFGACWVLAPFAAPNAASFVRLSCVFLLPLFLSIPFVSDWDRILAYGFPVIIPLVCAIHWRTFAAGFFLCLFAATLFVATNFSPSNSKLVVLIALLALSVAVGMVELYRTTYRRSFWLHRKV